MMNALSAGLSLGADRLFGEPSSYHPLVGFGNIADKLESLLNKNTSLFVRGLLAWCLLVIPVVVLVYWLDQFLGGLWLSVLCGWLAIGWKSLRLHGEAVVAALRADDIEQARTNTSYLVSRDTSGLDATELSRASIESLLENGSDALFAPLFWLLVGGAPLVVLYRLANTLDAMWGYRTERFEQFGKFSARVDDVLNIIPARLTALLYALSGNVKQAMTAWKTQGRRWYSPNAGVVMAAGAGALGLQLGGQAVYHGQLKQRPLLGSGKQPGVDDILAALGLVQRSEYLFLAVLLLLFFVNAVF
jgi:adenosylcobinamide-phosphate synthase